MALPVIQIMNQLQRGVREEIDDISDEETMADEEDGDIEVQAEEEEEVGENFQDTELELLDGDREGTKWLVINGVHICYMRKLQNVLARDHSTWLLLPLQPVDLEAS